MKLKLTVTTLTGGIFLLLAAAMLGQESGVSRPEVLNDTITTAPAAHYRKPSPAIPVESITTTTTVTPAAPALHLRETVTTATVIEPSGPVAPQAPLQTTRMRTVDTSNIVTDDDPTSGVVMEVPAGPSELPAATLLKAALRESISTESTAKGTHFSAALTADLGHHGRVLLPAGTLVNGRVTQVHGGRRLSGAAALRLQPDSVTLPDGTTYRIDAEVIDLDHFQDSHVNGEGTIVANGHAKATATALGLTTASAAVAGAMIGGGVGAVVGATIGAGVGVVWWLKKEHHETLPVGTEIVFSLDRSLDLQTAN